MSNYLRKAKKRKLKEQESFIVDLVKVWFHFFKDFKRWINDIVGLRNQSYVTYK